MGLKHLLAPVLAVAALGAVAPAAQAGLLVETAPDCEVKPVDQVFLPFVDPANYELAPGGRAESTAGWASLRSATIVTGGEPWDVVSERDNRALRIAADGSATTETFCVGLSHPTIRFFVRSSGTGLLSALEVEVEVETSTGALERLPVGVVAPTAGWWTTPPPMVLAPSLLPLLPGDMTPVRLRFTPVGTGAWHLDDIHVDPYRMK
jgi:hypothetical protein